MNWYWYLIIAMVVVIAVVITVVAHFNVSIKASKKKECERMFHEINEHRKKVTMSAEAEHVVNVVINKLELAYPEAGYKDALSYIHMAVKNEILKMKKRDCERYLRWRECSQEELIKSKKSLYMYCEEKLEMELRWLISFIKNELNR